MVVLSLSDRQAESLLALVREAEGEWVDFATTAGVVDLSGDRGYKRARRWRRYLERKVRDARAR